MKKQVKNRPVSKNSDWLIAKEEGIGVLNGDIVMLPVSMNTVVFKHVCLQTQPNTVNNQI